MTIFTQVWVSRYETYRSFRGLTGCQRTPQIWGVTKLNSSGIQNVGELAIIADNMEFYWNLCQIENGYQILLEMIPCINRIRITKEESSIMVECKQ